VQAELAFFLIATVRLHEKKSLKSCTSCILTVVNRYLKYVYSSRNFRKNIFESIPRYLKKHMLLEKIFFEIKIVNAF
jgi:hypothetical protein